MRATTVLPGAMFGRWKVLNELPSRHKHRLFQCRCECGTVKIVFLSALLSRLSGSCGCLRQEMATTHGQSWLSKRTTTYNVWIGMRSRCRTKHKRNRNYSGRGIKVCERWDKSFRAFLEDMGPRPEGKSLDRINNDGNYEPGNCRWVTMLQQLRNTRKNVWCWHQGHRRLLIEAAQAEGIRVATAVSRRKRGWPDARLFDAVKPSYAARSLKQR